VSVLDNAFWESLNGPHRAFSSGDGRARRYARGFPAIAGFPDPQRPDFEALGALFDPGEPFYTCGWSGAAPAGWRIEVDAHLFLMVFDADPPAADPAPEASALDRTHVDRMLALASLTRPGPFGPRNLDMGEYYGLLEDARLLAMAGERLHIGEYREISAVCTDPGEQGRGHARRLTRKLVARQAARGQTSILHVMSHNERALSMYERMGFRRHREFPVRVVART
jgi:ribosomal protein S18 acetylase RimI-like enzyme